MVLNEFIKVLLILSCLVFNSISLAQLNFTEVSNSVGITSYQMDYGKGGGIAVADFDSDGDLDLFLPTAGGVANLLYVNLGNGMFSEQAQNWGLDQVNRSRAALWLDYDNDQDLDLLVAGDCFEDADPNCHETSTLYLYQQENGVFNDVSIVLNFHADQVTDNLQTRGGISAGDINNDGYLDVAIGLWQGRMTLLLNNTNGTFTDVTQLSGLEEEGYYWQILFHDFNRDNWADMVVAKDFMPNHLWMNQTNISFLDTANSAGIDNDWNDMGMTLGDYDNDGDFDLYISNITNQTTNNVLFRNDSVFPVLSFSRQSHNANVAEAGFGWGTTFFDADNDRFLDLAATNGWFNGDAATDTSKLFINNGNGTFSDASASSSYNDNYWGSSLVAADFDRDGDLDLFQTCNGSGTQPHDLIVLASNASTLGNYITVVPRQRLLNHFAIGATVTLTQNGIQQKRIITAGTSFMGQEPAEAFFGLGQQSTIEKISVHWPIGFSSTLGPLAANQKIFINDDLLFLSGF